jgi:anti-sigma B factor antagonist
MAELDGAEARVTLQSDDDGSLTIALAGEIDISNFESVRKDIDALLPPSPTRLTFDLSELSFMDSSGITVLLQVASRVERVEVRNPSHVVRRIIETTGIERLLNITS